MRQLRFILVFLLTSLLVVSTAFWRKTIAVFLCGLLGFSSANYYSFLPKDEVYIASVPRNVDLTGTWINDRDGFTVTRDRCNPGSPSVTSIGGKTGRESSEIVITQDGSQLKSSPRKVVWTGGSLTYFFSGKVNSDNTVEFTETAGETSVGWGYTNTYTGTISSDGNTIKEGKISCKPSTSSIVTEGTFTWTRVNKSLPMQGDIVIYRASDGTITHSGVITGVHPDGTVAQIKSKWGAQGLYLHHPNYSIYGKSWTVHRAKRKDGSRSNLLRSGRYCVTIICVDAYFTDAAVKQDGTLDETNGNAVAWSTAIQKSGLRAEPGEKERTEAYLKMTFPPNMKPRQVELLTPEYNCHGFTFMNGKGYIQPSRAKGILNDNGYTLIPALDTSGFHHPDSGIDNIKSAT